ncbi:type I secretion C-terminal target domain-containing protein, partial [Mesorhizobium sp. M7A.F.Ca.US.006.01.1.1]|uniref:beta strand repeat-containing protein n=1 Tax=Mesorhizobium sp. M7A.F.Ca.US.006.01.1.1 TaxID=2496707 RepID=UPI000FCB3178
NYSYTLEHNVNHATDATPFETFTVHVADSDGNVADDPSASFQIAIVDDVPTAVADTDSVTEGGTASGNVITDASAGDVGDTDTGADTKGADGASVSHIQSNNVGGAGLDISGNTVINGQYGTLTIDASGQYSYVANSNISNASPVTDTFTYTLKDGDGDTSPTTLTITINDGAVAATPTPVTLDLNEAALLTAGATGSNPTLTTETDSTPALSFTAGSDALTSFAFSGTAGLVTDLDGNGSQDIFWQSVSGAQIKGYLDAAHTQLAVTLNLNAPGSIAAGATSSVTVTATLSDNLQHIVANGAQISSIGNVGVVATDTDGDTTTGIVNINVQDDVPTLGTVQSQQTSNDPVQTPAVGTLHFIAGADGAGAAMTITANTAGVTSAGHHLITDQSGNVLTAYADNNNDGNLDAGDTAVLTITVDPNAGTSGQYVFNLLAPLDGTVTKLPNASDGALGSGPTTNKYVENPTNHQLVTMVTGWAPTDAGGTFNAAHEAAWLAGDIPTLTQRNDVNGSNQGWGLGGNNFLTGQFMRFDFGALNDYDGAGSYGAPSPPSTLANAGFVTFSYNKTLDVGDKIEYVAHYVDGTTESFISGTGATGQTIQSSAGKQIAWVDVYDAHTPNGFKLNLSEIGVVSTTVDHTIPVTLQLTDGDGDTTGTANFTVHVAGGLTPFDVAAPIVLDLNHDGIHTTDLAHSTISYDYNGDGVASKTAWVDQHDGILAIDLNGDGKVSNASEFVFTQQAPGAATDLVALEQLYDTNHDGKLTAADHDFSQFGVWQDANGNGVSDPGEFKSLAALGIVEIGLTSDNQHSVSEDGSVLTYGGSTFTTASGETGAVADIGFGNFDTTGQTGTTGADTFKLDNLDIKDLITDYHGTGPGGEGDKIDLSALFDTASGSNINDYVHYDADTKTLSVDTTGSGNAANFVDVAALQNAPAAGTITILYDDTAHVQHTATI